MHYILFANIRKRMGARIFDFIITVGLTCAVFFGFVYKATFNETLYTENLDKLEELYDKSGLYIISNKGNITCIGAFTAINELEELTSIDLTSDDEKFDNVNLTEALYSFYANEYQFFGADYNLTFDIFKTNVLQVGKEVSNIKDLTYENGVFTYTLIDEEKEYQTVAFVKDAFIEAADFVTNSEKVRTLSNENDNLMFSSLYYLIPIFIGFSLIFDLIIPLCFKEGQSLGKLIFKVGILSKDGYRYKKYMLIIRWIAYLIVDMLLGILTFGGSILISYTMLLFNKRKRVIHDYISGSMVVDTKTLLYFKDAAEEQRFKEKMGTTSYGA